MARMCFMFEIFEGQEAEYKKRHDEIWPELVTAIKDAGFKITASFVAESMSLDISKSNLIQRQHLKSLESTKLMHGGPNGLKM